MSRPSTATSSNKPSSRFSTLKVFKFAGSKPPPLPPKDPYLLPNPSLPSLYPSVSEASSPHTTAPIYAQYATVPRSPSPSPSYAPSRVTVSPPTSTFASVESSGSRKPLFKLPSFSRRPKTPRTSDSDGSSMIPPPEPIDDPSISLPWNFQHNIHVDEGYAGLPPTWSDNLVELGFTEEEIANINARRLAARSQNSASVYDLRLSSSLASESSTPTTMYHPFRYGGTIHQGRSEVSLSRSSVSSVSRSDVRDTLVLSRAVDRSASVLSMSEVMTGYPNARASAALSSVPSTGSMGKAAGAPESVYSSSTGSASGSGKDKIPSTPPRRAYHVTNDSVSTIYSPPPAYKSHKTDPPLSGVDEETLAPPPVSDASSDGIISSVSRPPLIPTPPRGSPESTPPLHEPPMLSAPRLSLDKDTLGDLSSWSESLFSSIPSSVSASPPRPVATSSKHSFSNSSSSDRSIGVGASRMSTRPIPPQKPVPAYIFPPRKDSPRTLGPPPAAPSVPPPPPPTLKEPEPELKADPELESELEPSLTPPNTANTLNPLWHEVMSMVRPSDANSNPSTPSTSSSATTSTSIGDSPGTQFTPITPGGAVATKFPLIVETDDEEQLDAAALEDDEEQDSDELRVDRIREKDNRDSGMSTVTVTPATIVRGAIARSARANVIPSPARVSEDKDVQPSTISTNDEDAPAQQTRSQSPDGSDSSESISSMTMSMSTSGTTSTSADSRPQTLNVSDVQEWRVGGVLPKTALPSPREATFSDSERGLLAAPPLSVTITNEDDDPQSDLLGYTPPSIVISNVMSSPSMASEERAASPASTTSSSASPGTPAPRYPGWVSEVVAPLRAFIDDSIDPRDLFADLQEIAEGESGSVYAARVKAVPPDDAAAFVAIKNVPILPSGSPKLEDLRGELELMKNVRHVHILSMDALYVDLVEDSLWIRMDLMERSLADVIGLVCEGIVVDEAPLAQFASDVLQALVYLQKQRIAHRDLRSDNLLVRRDGVVKIADFSNAVRVSHAAPIRSDIAGVIYWQCPEMRCGGSYNALKVDVWSLGATMWEMAQAEPPFSDIVNPQLMGDRWPPLNQPELFSRSFHDFLHLCSQSSDLRPDPKQLLNTPFIKNASGREAVVDLLSQCRSVEEHLSKRHSVSSGGTVSLS